MEEIEGLWVKLGRASVVLDRDMMEGFLKAIKGLWEVVLVVEVGTRAGDMGGVKWSIPLVVGLVLVLLVFRLESSFCWDWVDEVEAIERFEPSLGGEGGGDGGK